MASVLQPASILSLLPEEEFLDREADIQRLFHAGLDTARALTPSLFLNGPRKSGKTEILKRVYRRLFLEQEAVLPFYHAVPKCVSTAEAFCREYFLRNIFQFLAFSRREPELGSTKEFSLNYAFQLAYESKHPWLVELVDHFHAGLRKKDLQALSRLAIHFPLTAALNTGLSAFVIVDDFPHIASLKSEEELTLLSGDFLSALSSRRTPHLLSGFSTHALQGLFNTVEIPGNVDVYPLRGLDALEAKQLLENLCDRFSVALEPGLSSAIVSQLDCYPFYIRSVVEGARREELHLQTPREFAEVYTNELTRGNLHLYFSSLLNSTSLNLAEKMKALEILHTSSRGPLDFSALHFIQEEVGGIGPDPERILETLRRATLLDQGIGTITPITDTVLGDWIEWNFRHSLRGVPMNEARYQITANLLKRFQGNVQTSLQADRLEQLERLLDIMDCQSVPMALLDFSQFSALEQIQDPQKLSKYLYESEQLILPEMLSISREGSLGGKNADSGGPILVGRGFEEGQYDEEREAVWLVSYYSREGLVGLNEIQQFRDKCLRTARERRYQRIRMWLIAESRFNQAALSFAREHRVMTSNWNQFGLLLNRLAPTSHISEQAMPRELTTFEMVIPVSADSELVPVRALEQIAENLNLEDKAKGQVRMALMEACINAKECAVTPGGRIYLRFQGRADALLIHLRVENLPYKGESQAKPTVEVWNLKLLRSLMDEAQFSHGPSGLELSMTKYLSKTLPQAG